MSEHIVKLRSVKNVTHDVLTIETEKPSGYSFMPGQATEVSINKGDWKNEKRPFTFTCLPKANYLEFTIKTYPAKKSVTNELLQLKAGDELIIRNVFGAIGYRGEGVFIAGGAGITPFIAILRSLHSKHEIRNNRLIFANKTKADIILEDELRKILGAGFLNILSEEKIEGYENGMITADFIKENSGGLDKMFYVCGPPTMMEAVLNQLNGLGVNKSRIVKESF